MWHRGEALGRKGAIAAGHPLAAFTGLKVLSQGGNAIDSAIAAAAVSAVVLPHACSIGGDAFMIIRPERGEVKALNASGPAPASAHREAFLKEGIPKAGASASTVPGVLQGWEEALKSYGTMELGEALEEAIRYAEEGFCTSSKLSEAIARWAPTFEQFPDWRSLFTPSGAPLRPGQLLVQKGLAQTLRVIAKEGAQAFYGGEVGQKFVRFCQENGGLIDCNDLEGYRCRWEEPIKTGYRGFEVLEVPPNSWGFLLLLQLNLLEGFDLASMKHNSTDYIHTMLEAKRLAFAVKERFLGDPDFSPIPLEGLLSKSYAEKLRGTMNPDRAGTVIPDLNPPHPSDTTYMAVAAGRGNLVSLIQSIFMPFGCGRVAGDTGIVMNNRMTGFTLEPHARKRQARHHRPGDILPQGWGGPQAGGGCPGPMTPSITSPPLSNL